MKHEVFNACMAFHDHAITGSQFAHKIWELIPYPHYQWFQVFVNLCGGA